MLGVQVLRLQATVQDSQAQLASQTAELDCKATLITDLRNDITAACSEIEALSQLIQTHPNEPSDTTDMPSEETPESEEELPQSAPGHSQSHRVLISFPLLLVRSSLKIGLIAAGTLLAERAYGQHNQAGMQTGQPAARKVA